METFKDICIHNRLRLDGRDSIQINAKLGDFDQVIKAY